MEETSRFSQLEIDVDDAPAFKPAPEASAATTPRCTRCNVASPLTAGVCAVCARVAADQAAQAANGGKSRAPALPRLRALLAEVEAGTTAYGLVPGMTAEQLREELTRSLRGLMNRVPQARVDGRAYTAPGATAAPEQTLGAVAESLAPNETPVAQAVYGNALHPSVLGAILPAAESARVQDLVGVADQASSSGTMTYWSLPGSVDVGRLLAAWAAEGLDPAQLPAVPSPQVALHRACKEQASKHRMLRQHPKGGWCLVDERRAGDTLAYEVGTRFRLSEDGKTILVTPPGGKDAAPQALAEARELGAAVRAEFNRLQSEIASVDVSVWLVRRCAALGGVALRESGGFYFVPKGRTDELARIARALGAASAHTVYEIPVMQGTKTVAAVLDALRREVQEEIAALEGELNGGDMGTRAARTRATACADLATKVRGYEQLLGVRLGEAVARLDALRTRCEAQTTRFSSLEVG